MEVVMKKQQAEEDLQFIREMLKETRRTVADNGMHYINWSIMPSLGIIGTYLVLMTESPSVYIFWIWTAVIGLGWLFSIILGARGSRGRSPNFAERILSSVWITSGITMTLIAFGGMVSGAFSPHLIPALIAVILGIPFFIAGMIYDLHWFKLISVGWWIAGTSFFFWNSFHSLAALGVLLILFQVLPGIYLYKSFGSHKEPSLSG